ncbi:hypothetical protein cand_014930 [Cryptosporidium andersoni]|uniref:Uncharacterized protein n=1 Tax=Cryptosporidium andersoni TaxID=117008 RepID=A0A1J4MXM1_9CRYT|nr:hypothetical protein cand_014930 [Cryptosporidium andersoni]
MGSVTSTPSHDKHVYPKNNNSIEPLSRSYSNVELPSVTPISRSQSIQTLSAPLIVDSVSDLIDRISSRLNKNYRIVKHLALACPKDYYLNKQNTYEENTYVKKDEKFKWLNLFSHNLRYSGYDLQIEDRNFEILDARNETGALNPSSKQHCLGSTCQFKGHSLYEDSKLYVVYGHLNNHKPFLSPGIIDAFLPFILDETLLTCFTVCPHWFLTLVCHMNQVYSHLIDDQFKENYKGYLELEHATVTMQPVLTVCGSVRIDRVLYAKVLKSCAKKCVTIAYNFKYDKNSDSALNKYSKVSDRSLSNKKRQSLFGLIISPVKSSDINEAYLSIYKFETFYTGTRRKQWAHKDISRCHSEEVCVAQTTMIPSVNVGDRIEIAVNLSNSFGVVNIKSIEFQPISFETIKSENCEAEDLYPNTSDWNPIYNQSEVAENFHIPDLSPNLIITETEYAGTDLVTCRVHYKAVKCGELSNAEKIFGIDIVVLPRDYAIICPLKRIGLQHDRYSPLQIRIDDTIVLYITKGGAIPE